MSRFAEGRAEVEEFICENLGEKPWAPIDIMASIIMADLDRAARRSIANVELAGRIQGAE